MVFDFKRIFFLSLFIFFLFSTPSFASQVHTIKSWGLVEKTGRFDFLDVMNIKFKDLGTYKWQGQDYYVFKVTIEPKDLMHGGGFEGEIPIMTLREKIKQCYKESWSNSCLQEMIEWYFPFEYSVSELKEDFKDFYQGIKKVASTDKVAIKMIGIDKQSLRISFYVGIKDKWRVRQRFKLGRKSQIYQSGNNYVEYVELLGKPDITYELVSGGNLVSDLEYHFMIYALWSDTDRRTTNYTRCHSDCGYITTNSSHRTINITFPKIANAYQYWIKFGSSGGSSYAKCGYLYYYWQHNITGSDANGFTSGSNATHIWVAKSTTTTPNYNWDAPMLQDHDQNVPMFRVWTNWATNSFSDIYDASVSEGWGHVTNEGTNQYFLNASYQCGSQYDTCSHLTRNEQVGVKENFIVYNGTFTSGTFDGGDRTYWGSQITIFTRYSNTWGSRYFFSKGQLFIDTEGTTRLYDSHLMNNNTREESYTWNTEITNYGNLTLNRVYLSDRFQNQANSETYMNHVYFTKNYPSLSEPCDQLNDLVVKGGTYGIIAFPVSYCPSITSVSASNIDIGEGVQRPFYLYGCVEFNCTNCDTSGYTIAEIMFYRSFNTVWDKKSFDLKVIDEAGSPIDSATLNITCERYEYECDHNSCDNVFQLSDETVLSTTTNSSGKIDTHGFDYRFIESTGSGVSYLHNKTFYYNCEFLTEKSGYETLNFTANITKETDWTLAMGASNGNGGGVSPQTEMVYCAWKKDIEIGNNGFIFWKKKRIYTLCLDQNGNLKLFLKKED